MRFAREIALSDRAFCAATVGLWVGLLPGRLAVIISKACWLLFTLFVIARLINATWRSSGHTRAGWACGALAAAAFSTTVIALNESARLWPDRNPPWIAFDIGLSIGLAATTVSLAFLGHRTPVAARRQLADVVTFATAATLFIWSTDYVVIIARHTLMAAFWKSVLTTAALSVLMTAVYAVSQLRRCPRSWYAGCGWVLAAIGIIALSAAWTRGHRVPVTTAFGVVSLGSAAMAYFGTHAPERPGPGTRHPTKTFAPEVALAIGLCAVLTKLPNSPQLATIVCFQLAAVACITAISSLSHRYENAAFHNLLTTDVPTGVLSEFQFRRWLTAWHAEVGSDERGVVALEVIGLERIRAAHGNAAAISITQKAAQLAKGIMPIGSDIYRLHGDRFAIVITSAEAAHHIARFALNARDLPTGCTCPTHVVHMRVATVIRLVRPSTLDTHSIEQLLQGPSATIDLSDRSQLVTADVTPHTIAVSDIVLATRLGVAIERQELSVYFQPVVRASDYGLTSFEALSRWTVDGQHISPERFVRVAEHVGYINALTDNVIRTSCRQLVAWQGMLARHVTVSVNISSTSLAAPDFISQLAEIVEEYGLSPSQFVLEITESQQIRAECNAIAVFNAAAHHGFQLALDDFGTGWSTLAQLMDLPFSRVKLDKSTISGIEVDIDRRQVVEQVLAMCHARRVTTVVEGVETREQANILSGIGADYLQGYLFGRPQAGDYWTPLTLQPPALTQQRGPAQLQPPAHLQPPAARIHNPRHHSG